MTKTGIVIGRFQTADLHQGHLRFLGYVNSKCEQMFIVLGVPRTPLSKRNPLDYQSRRLMLSNVFPHAQILPLQDCKEDSTWSENLDQLIRTAAPHSQVTLYGGKSSFIPRYMGKYATFQVQKEDLGFETASIEEIEDFWSLSATDCRASVKLRSNSIFREGMVYAQNCMPNRLYKTVDMAVVDGNQLLVGKKPGEFHYRFPGGFVDVTDYTLEHAASRELAEETGLRIHPNRFIYVCSRLGDDWRYKGPDRIMTTLFLVENKIDLDELAAGDDLSAGIAKLDIFESDTQKQITPNHQNLLTALRIKLMDSKADLRTSALPSV